MSLIPVFIAEISTILHTGVNGLPGCRKHDAAKTATAEESKGPYWSKPFWAGWLNRLVTQSCWSVTTVWFEGQPLPLFNLFLIKKKSQKVTFLPFYIIFNLHIVAITGDCVIKWTHTGPSTFTPSIPSLFTLEHFKSHIYVLLTHLKHFHPW